MRRPSVSRTIAARGEDAWGVLVDTERWPEWGPSISAVESSSRHVAPGVQGRVRTTVGLWLPFVIDRVETGRFWSWRVAGVGATGHRVEALAARVCRVTFEVPPIAVPYLAVCALALRRIDRLIAGERDAGRPRP